MRDRKSRFIRAFTVFVSGQKEKCYRVPNASLSSIIIFPSGKAAFAMRLVSSGISVDSVTLNIPYYDFFGGFATSITYFIKIKLFRSARISKW